jgi:vancomycin resistance protein VanJ
VLETTPAVGAAPAISSRRWTIRRIFGKILAIVVDEYSIVLLAFLVAKWTVGERWEIIALGNSFVHLALLPTLILFPLALIRRRWAIALILVLSLIYLVGSYATLFLPRAVIAAPSGAKSLTILTYNIHSETQRLDPMIALIREADPDVVAMQEVSQEAARRFDQVLADRYPYRKLHTFPGNGVVGQGVLSKYPILNDNYWRNENLPDKLGHQRIQIDVNSVAVTLYNAHPIHPILKGGHLFYTELRAQEIQSVLDRASHEYGPLIIVGDFNMADQSGDYQQITARYADTYREVGWGLGPTFPDFSSVNAVPGAVRALPVPPLVRLDYVFHNDALYPIEARVWNSSGGSDHRPVFVRLAVSTQPHE